MDHLRKAALAGIEPRPGLAAARAIFGDGDDARNVRVARGGERRADQARRLCKEPAAARHPGLQNFAAIDHAARAGEALAEAAANRWRERRPILRTHQRAKPEISDLRLKFGCAWRLR